MVQRTTIYLDQRLHQAIKIKAVQRHTSVSDLVNEALRDSLEEDRSDLEAIRKRAHEPTRSFEVVLKDLKRDGLL